MKRTKEIVVDEYVEKRTKTVARKKIKIAVTYNIHFGGKFKALCPLCSDTTSRLVLYLDELEKRQYNMFDITKDVKNDFIKKVKEYCGVVIKFETVGHCITKLVNADVLLNPKVGQYQFNSLLIWHGTMEDRERSIKAQYDYLKALSKKRMAKKTVKKNK